MADPILRAIDVAGESWDDPSEDLLFMFMEDLDHPGASFLVERVVSGREDDFMRITAHNDDGYLLEGPQAVGIGPVQSMRAVHEALTRWAFDLADWREPLSRPRDDE